MSPCDVWGVSTLCQAGRDAVGSLVEDGSVRVLSAIARGITSFAVMLLDGLWTLIQTATTPQMDADFVYEWAGMLFGLSLPIVVIFMVFQVIQSLLQARGVTRSGVISAVTGAALAIFGTAVSLPVVHNLTAAVDGAAEAMSGVIVGDLDSLGEDFANAIGGRGRPMHELFSPLGQQEVIGDTMAGALGGLIGMIVLGFLMIVGAIAVFAALLIRTMLLYVVVVTGPIAFLGLVWSPARPWFRRWATAVVALIFTKLGVVVVFGLGVAAMNNLDFDGGVLESLARLLTGALLMLIAALVPIVAFRFFGFLGEETVTSLHAGAQSGVARATEVAGRMDPRRVAERLSSNGHSGAAPSTSNGARTPQAQPADGDRPSVSGQGTSSRARRGPSDPWKSASASNGSTPRNGQPSSGNGGGSGWTSGSLIRPGSGAGSGSGAAAAGGVAGAAGAVIGAGVAAGQTAASAGQRAGRRLADDEPTRPRPPATQRCPSA